MFKNLTNRFQKLFGLHTWLIVSMVATPRVSWASNSSVQVTIVSDASNTALPGALVYLIHYGDHGPDSTLSQIITSDSQGQATFSVPNDNEYDIYAGKQGRGPTVRTQMYSPSHIHIKVNASGSRVNQDGSADTRTLKIALTQDITADRAQITTTVTNVAETDGSIIFGNVRKKSNSVDVAWGAGVVASNQATVEFFNLPAPANASVYDLGVYDPQAFEGRGNGNGTTVSSALAVGDDLAVPLSLNNGTPPDVTASNGNQSQDTANAQNQNISGGKVYGAVLNKNDNSKVIPYTGVNIMVYENGAFQPRQWASADANGRYEIQGLQADKDYYVQFQGGCWSAPNQAQSCYEPEGAPETRADATLGANDFHTPSDLLTTPYKKTIQITPAASGNADFWVKVQDSSGRALPRSGVGIWPDGSNWWVDAQNPLDCNAPATNVNRKQGFSQLNVQSDDGYVHVTNFREGNYQINANTMFSRQGTNFNAGADQDFSFGQGFHGCFDTTPGTDDLRVSVSQDQSSVKVFGVNGVEKTSITNPTLVGTHLGKPMIIVTVPTDVTGGGTLTGTLKFPRPVDLTAEPISIIASDCEGSNGCSGNLDVIPHDGDPINQTEYTYSFNLPKSFLDNGNQKFYSYNIQIVSKYWAAVQSGGSSNVSFETADVMHRDFKFVRGGAYSGHIIIPDGSKFRPTNSGMDSVSGGIELHSNSGWGNGQADTTGNIFVGGLVPGKYQAQATFWANTDQGYTSPEPLKTIEIKPEQITTADIQVITGVPVVPVTDMTKLPQLLTYKSEHNNFTNETWETLPVSAGTKLDSDYLAQTLVNDNGRGAMFRRPEIPNGQNSSPCGTGPETWCGDKKAPGTYDAYLVRKGDLGGDAPVGVDNPIRTHMYMTFVSEVKNVKVAQSEVGPNAPLPMSNATVPAVPFNFPLTTAVPQGAIVKGIMQAPAILTEQDFHNLNGDFSLFVKYLPFGVLTDSRGKVVSVFIVAPPPAKIDQVGSRFDEALAGDNWTAFSGIFDQFFNVMEFEVRGIQPGRYTLAVTSPHWPPYITNITVASSDVDLGTIDLKTGNHSGATLTGVISDSSNTDPVSGAVLELNMRGMKTKTFTTTSDGTYSFDGLPVGHFLMTINAPGYAAKAKRIVITSFSAATQNVALAPAAGVISGTVRELASTQLGPVVRAIQEAGVFAIDDTDAGSSTDPLAATKAVTDENGKYTLTGLVVGHHYKISAKAPGRYVSKKEVDIGATNVDLDFVLTDKPLTIELASRIDPTNNVEEFKILNAHNFSDGAAYWGPATLLTENTDGSITFDTANASAHLLNFTELPDYLLGTVPLSSLTDGVQYVLYIAAVSAVDDSVVKKFVKFGSAIGASVNTNIDEDLAEAGDAVLDIGDNASLTLEAGSMEGSDDVELPAIAVTAGSAADVSNDSSSDPISLSGANDVKFSFVQFTGRQVEFCAKLGQSNFTDEELARLRILVNNGSSLTAANANQIASFDPVTRLACGTFDPSPFVTTSADRAITSSSKGLKTAAVAPKPVNMNMLWDGHKHTKNVRAAATGTLTLSAGLVPSFSTSTAVTAVKYMQYNFPNPFNLKTKTVTTRDSGVPSSIQGTYIVVAPTGTGTPEVTIRIYNVAGDLVREMKGNCTAGILNYFNWDGKNTAGSDVASGVYFASVDSPGAPKKEPIKMVVVK